MEYGWLVKFMCDHITWCLPVNALSLASTYAEHAMYAARPPGNVTLGIHVHTLRQYDV